MAAGADICLAYSPGDFRIARASRAAKRLAHSVQHPPDRWGMLSGFSWLQDVFSVRSSFWSER